MLVELIPVLEITAYTHEVPAPAQGPYWEFPAEWDAYNKACLVKAGYESIPLPYSPGSAFYRLTALSFETLVALVRKQTEELRAGKIEREDGMALYGGCVLRVDKQDQLFPQCCSELSNIHNWEKVGWGDGLSFWQGHPSPKVTSGAGTVSFDFSFSDTGEAFAPPTKNMLITVEHDALNAAIVKAKGELVEFGQRLRRLNEVEALGIEDLDNLLIRGE